MGGTGNDTFYFDGTDTLEDAGGADSVLNSGTIVLNKFKNAAIEYVELLGSDNLNATAKKTGCRHPGGQQRQQQAHRQRWG